jgi:hypothetical protein
MTSVGSDELADEHATDHETLIRYLVNGEFNNPVRIVFSIKGWCRYVTMDVADELTAGSVLQFLDTNRP